MPSNPPDSVVPPSLHMVWTGRGFSLPHWLAIESAKLANPSWQITLHLVDAPAASPELEQVRRDPRVTVRERTAREIVEAARHAPLPADRLWALYRAIPPQAASARTNLLRYLILWEEGGVYLDLDVLVLRSLEPLRAAPCVLGEELVWRADAARVAGQYAWWMLAPTVAFGAAIAMHRWDGALGVRIPPAWHRRLERAWSEAQPNNAVIGAAPRAPFLAMLLERAAAVDPTVRYRLGPTLVTEVARAHPALVRLLPPEVLYWLPPSQTFRMFRRARSAHASGIDIPSPALLVHYVASNHRRELRAVAERGLGALPPCPFRHLAAAVAAGRSPLLEI